MTALELPTASVDDVIGGVFLTTFSLVLLGAVALCIRRGWPVIMAIPSSIAVMGVVALGMGRDNLGRVAGPLFGTPFLWMLGGLIVLLVGLAARDLIQSANRRKRSPWRSDRSPPDEL